MYIGMSCFEVLYIAQLAQFKSNIIGVLDKRCEDFVGLVCNDMILGWINQTKSINFNKGGGGGRGGGERECLTTIQVHFEVFGEGYTPGIYSWTNKIVAIGMDKLLQTSNHVLKKKSVWMTKLHVGD